MSLSLALRAGVRTGTIEAVAPTHAGYSARPAAGKPQDIARPVAMIAQPAGSEPRNAGN